VEKTRQKEKNKGKKTKIIKVRTGSKRDNIQYVYKTRNRGVKMNKSAM
jgi:hypothetical protein